jgi:ankyrin repeat protein
VSDEVKSAIEAADAGRLRALVEAEPALARSDVRFGPGDRHSVPPLHYVCDVVFRGLVGQEQALELADLLLAAGVDVDEVYARSGDTFLIAAASLGAEDVGLRLVERGADVTRCGLFGATALHWAVLMGLERLTPALAAAGAALELADERYDCTPLQWGLHAWAEGSSGRREGIPAAVRALVERGARVPAGALEGLSAPGDAPLRAALGSAGEG